MLSSSSSFFGFLFRIRKIQCLWLSITSALTRLLNLFFPTFMPLNANNARCSWTVYSMQNNIFIIPEAIGNGTEPNIRRFWINSNSNGINPFPKKRRNQECGRDLTNFYFFGPCSSHILIATISSLNFLVFFSTNFFPNAPHRVRFWWYKISHYLWCNNVVREYATIATVSPRSAIHRNTLKPDDFNVSWFTVGMDERRRKASLRQSD